MRECGTYRVYYWFNIQNCSYFRKCDVNIVCITSFPTASTFLVISMGNIKAKLIFQIIVAHSEFTKPISNHGKWRSILPRSTWHWFKMLLYIWTFSKTTGHHMKNHTKRDPLCRNTARWLCCTSSTTLLKLVMFQGHQTSLLMAPKTF